MTRHFRQLMVCTVGLTLASALEAEAKPPSVPTVPETEFKVLSANAQEHYQPDDATAANPYLPVVSWSPGSAAIGALSGTGMHLAWTANPPAEWSLKAAFTFRAGSGSFINKDWAARLEVTIDRMDLAADESMKKHRQARDVYEMAETHREAGDWEEAKRWYAGIKQLYPRSFYAELAEKRLERLALLRIAAEAGEEQSEEPPILKPSSK